MMNEDVGGCDGDGDDIETHSDVAYGRSMLTEPAYCGPTNTHLFGSMHCLLGDAA